MKSANMTSMRATDDKRDKHDVFDKPCLHVVDPYCLVLANGVLVAELNLRHNVKVRRGDGPCLGKTTHGGADV